MELKILKLDDDWHIETVRDAPAFFHTTCRYKSVPSHQLTGRFIIGINHYKTCPECDEPLSDETVDKIKFLYENNNSQQ